MQKEDIVKCHFVPMSSMKKVMDYIESKATEPYTRCKRNVLELQMSRSSQEANREKFRTRYHIAVTKAVYSHDWNKLLYLMKKSPPWEHCTRPLDELYPYVRALTILLMYHPSSKAQGLLNDYLHLALACRTDAEKKAVLKVILTLPEKISRPHSNQV